VGIVPPCVVGRKCRVAHQVADGLHHVPLGIEAELLGCRLVAPFDAALRVEQHHTVGRGLQRSQELLQTLLTLQQLQLTLAQQAARAVGDLAKHAMHGRGTGRITPAQPAQHPQGAQQVHHKPQPSRTDAARQRAPGFIKVPAQRRAHELEGHKDQETQQHAQRITCEAQVQDTLA